MDVIVTTFKNPFSFFCIREDAVKVQYIDLPENNGAHGLPSNKRDLSEVTHGQYIAVIWNNNWARGVVTLEAQFQIWLVDYGIYIRPNEKTIFVKLPPEDKKNPTKVFEASIRGVTPITKVMNMDCEIINEVSTTWDDGSIKKARELIAGASKVYFVPIAIMSTKINDVVVGDLYLRMKDKGVCSVIDLLEEWPVFLKRDSKLYTNELSKFYTSRRKHRASLIKPVFPHRELPTMTLQTTLDEYNAICARAPELECSEASDSSDEGSTITYLETALSPERDEFKLTAAEIEKYSNSYITISGTEYNILNVLLNKARDLSICEQYKDLKSIGRATSRSKTSEF